MRRLVLRLGLVLLGLTLGLNGMLSLVKAYKRRMVKLANGRSGIHTLSPVLPVTLPIAFWIAPVVESTTALRVEVLSLVDILISCRVISLL